MSATEEEIEEIIQQLEEDKRITDALEEQQRQWNALQEEQRKMEALKQEKKRKLNALKEQEEEQRQLLETKEEEKRKLVYIENQLQKLALDQNKEEEDLNIIKRGQDTKTWNEVDSDNPDYNSFEQPNVRIKREKIRIELRRQDLEKQFKTKRIIQPQLKEVNESVEEVEELFEKRTDENLGHQIQNREEDEKVKDNDKPQEVEEKKLKETQKKRKPKGRR